MCVTGIRSTKVGGELWSIGLADAEQFVGPFTHFGPIEVQTPVKQNSMEPTRSAFLFIG